MVEPCILGATTLYLIRHGESTAQAERIVGGVRGDRGLTPLGVWQARRLRDRLAATGEVVADVLIASTMPRARQTAQIIAPALGLPIVWDDEVQEIRPGAADGLTSEQAEERYHVSTAQRELTQPMSPGGESWVQFNERVGRALERIAREHASKTVAVVCHAGVVECSFRQFFHVPTTSLPPVELWTQNTSITVWQQLLDDPSNRWRLLRYNDTIHLFQMRGRPLDWEALGARAVTGGDRSAVPLPGERTQHGPS